MKRRQPIRSERFVRGMTLIEVLVAFVILAMVMSVIMRINATALRNHEVSNDYQLALRVAESRLEAMSTDRTSGYLVQQGVDEGGIGWEYKREPYTGWEEQRLQGLAQIPVEEHITVSWGNEESPRQLSFSRIQLIQKGR